MKIVETPAELLSVVIKMLRSSTTVVVGNKGGARKSLLEKQFGRLLRQNI